MTILNSVASAAWVWNYSVHTCMIIKCWHSMIHEYCNWDIFYINLLSIRSGVDCLNSKSLSYIFGPIKKLPFSLLLKWTYTCIMRGLILWTLFFYININLVKPNYDWNWFKYNFILWCMFVKLGSTIRVKSSSEPKAKTHQLENPTIEQTGTAGAFYE